LPTYNFFTVVLLVRPAAKRASLARLKRQDLGPRAVSHGPATPG
jgi:hypothetical protein